MNELKFTDYSFIECEKPFHSVVFKVDGDKITFTIHDNGKSYMEINGVATIEAVEEAIKIVKSRTLEF